MVAAPDGELHDGSAKKVPAIEVLVRVTARADGTGEAAHAISLYQGLSPADQATLMAFLNSL